MAESAAKLEFQRDFALTIDGQFVAGDEIMEVIDPATEEVFAIAPAAGREHLEQAVAAARRASGDWRARSFEERAELIRQYSVLLRENKHELGTLLTREQGKPSASRWRSSSGEPPRPTAWRASGSRSRCCWKTTSAASNCIIGRWGVVGIITPWNAPAALALGSLSAALYTGNTVVLKPSPYTPLTTLRMGELAQSVFPPGVVNVLAAGNDLGQWMTEHPDIDKISFTGSVATGKKVLATASETLKARHAGTRRQRSGHRSRRRRPARHRQVPVLRLLREQRPGLHGGQAHLCARERLR